MRVDERETMFFLILSIKELRRMVTRKKLVKKAGLNNLSSSNISHSDTAVSLQSSFKDGC